MTENDAAVLVWTVAGFVALSGWLVVFGAVWSDLESLIERARNGLSRIEAREHVLTSIQWVYTSAIIFGVGLLTLSDIPGRGSASRWLLVSLAIVMAMAPIWYLRERRRKLRLYIAEEQRSDAVSTADLRADLESYRQMAEVAIENLERASNVLLAERGEPPLDVIAPVIAEHSSPTTAQQRETAEVATKRARLVAASKPLDAVSPETPTGEAP